jgi:hypothetical protein
MFERYEVSFCCNSIAAADRCRLTGRRIMTKSVSVYLAGKITKNGWRNDIVASSALGQSEWAMEAMSNELGQKWETAMDALGEGVHLAGPFFVGCDHGCGHGPQAHGITGGCIVTDAGQKETVRLCTQALEESDVVFAWLDALDAYGTLVELGYAKALGKRIIIAHPPQTAIRSDELSGDLEERNDMWFAYSLADVEIAAPSAREAWAMALPKLESRHELLSI